MMKVVTVLMTALLGLSLAAGESLWNGEASSVAVVSKLANQQVEVRDGVLTVTLPVAEKAKPRKVVVAGVAAAPEVAAE